LGLSQVQFALLAGASKHSQIDWEANRASPNARDLASLAAAGADVLYIVVGRRADALALALNAALLREVLDGIETGLTRRRQRLTPGKKAELVALLYERFAERGKADRETVERHLMLVA